MVCVKVHMYMHAYIPTMLVTRADKATLVWMSHAMDSIVWYDPTMACLCDGWLGDPMHRARPDPQECSALLATMRSPMAVVRGREVRDTQPDKPAGPPGPRTLPRPLYIVPTTPTPLAWPHAFQYTHTAPHVSFIYVCVTCFRRNSVSNVVEMWLSWTKRREGVRGCVVVRHNGTILRISHRPR